MHIKLWDEVDPDTVVIEKRPVGKLYISVKKLTQPARWKQLNLEDTPKPQGGRIWFERHQIHFSALYDFEDDDIEDFEGHDMIQDEREEPDDDDTWMFPPKGPGEFEHLKKKKKKGKRGKKGKGKKKASQKK